MLVFCCVVWGVGWGLGCCGVVVSGVVFGWDVGCWVVVCGCCVWFVVVGVVVGYS